MDYLEKLREENTLKVAEKQSKEFYKEISESLSEQIKSGQTTLRHYGPRMKEINLGYIKACYDFADKLQLKVTDKFVDVESLCVASGTYLKQHTCIIILEVMDKVKKS